MSVPEKERSALRQKLWAAADQLGWISLSPTEKSKWYEIWTRDPETGGHLARFMDKGQVRVYIKDTLLKAYGQTRLSNSSRPFRSLNLQPSEQIKEKYVKPHGRLLADGRVLCWGRADDWKSIIMAVHERAFLARDGRPFAAVFMFSSGRYHESYSRTLVEDAASKLGIERVVWLD